MIIYGTIKGFKKEEIDKYGFPIDGIQLCINSDIISEQCEAYDIFTGTDVYLDTNSAICSVRGNNLQFEVECRCLTLDGNDVDFDLDGDLVYSIIRNSYVTGVFLVDEYSDYSDPMEREKLKKMKFTESLLFSIGSGSVFKKCNKVKFY